MKPMQRQRGELVPIGDALADLAATKCGYRMSYMRYDIEQRYCPA